MDKLKPCPNCGSSKVKKRYKQPYSSVVCKECGIKVVVADSYEQADGMSEAVEIWNGMESEGE
jgi:transcription initiation factor TFIIIB Brf1 subunit/transcription initiation factor TFIIB